MANKEINRRDFLQMSGMLGLGIAGASTLLSSCSPKQTPLREAGTYYIPELPDKNQLILVYCRSGNRSKQASEKLASLGYTNIVEFGGINSWTYGTVSE